MSVNYLIIGAAIVVVGAGCYFVYKNKKIKDPAAIDPSKLTVKNMDVIDLSCVGPWLKDKDVDLDDFDKGIKLYALKSIRSSVSSLGLPKEVAKKITEDAGKEVVAFVLSDKDNNTLHALIVVGDAIDENLKNMMATDVTEIHIK